MPVTADVPAVALDGVSFAYRGGPRVLEDVSLEVERGAFLGIAGPNGGGKTTLLRLVLGLERPTAGHVRLFGGAPQSRGAPRVGYVSQRAQLASATPVTVREVVEAGRL
ncbi:MAG: ATP-binding cassette domain-containing protein, partial [Gaiella sp.]